MFYSKVTTAAHEDARICRLGVCAAARAVAPVPLARGCILRILGVAGHGCWAAQGRFGRSRFVLTSFPLCRPLLLQVLFVKKGELAQVWIAAHWERKLKKTQVAGVDIQLSAEQISNPVRRRPWRASLCCTGVLTRCSFWRCGVRARCACAHAGRTAGSARVGPAAAGPCAHLLAQSAVPARRRQHRPHQDQGGLLQEEAQNRRHRRGLPARLLRSEKAAADDVSPCVVCRPRWVRAIRSTLPTRTRLATSTLTFPISTTS